MLHQFDTRIVTPARGSSFVIVRITGFTEDGVPEWYFANPNGSRDTDALKLCSEADYLRITEQCVLELDEMLDTEPDYEGMADDLDQRRSMYEYTR
ncbi:MAG: hypothetical protein ACMV1D_08965 [Macromonas sp.]